MTRRRQTITIQEDTSDIGQIAEAWSDRKKLFANAHDVTGGEVFRGRQIEAEVSVVFDTNYHEWLTPMMRAKYRGETYEIRTVLDRQHRRRELELHCTRIADDG